MGGQRHNPTAVLPGKIHGTHCIAGWLVLESAESGPPTGIRTSHPQANSESLYRQQYPGRLKIGVLYMSGLITSSDSHEITLT